MPGGNEGQSKQDLLLSPPRASHPDFFSLSSKTPVSQGLTAVLERFLTLMPDCRQITISTTEGAELMTAARAAVTAEDTHTISSLAPSFSTSIEQVQSRSRFLPH